MSSAVGHNCLVDHADGAAARPPIVDTNADDGRGRDGANKRH
jgi:hypothetical protein